MKTAKQLLDEAVSHQFDKKDSFRAIELYKVIIEQYPDTSEANQALEHLEYLDEESTKAPPNAAVYKATYSPSASRTKQGERFPNLTYYSQGLKVVGWMVLVFGLLACVGLFGIFEGWKLLLACGLVFSFTTPLSGGLILQAEIVELFLSIEDNTFRSQQALQQIAKNTGA
ncbi:hypothetical protein FRD01_07850 [Microvenator marinus]|uniref:Tetratricopeptide repeat protein n=1 Tax=Microvenator marinus TaxID=2600177 RepID=A0A5B8XPY8_9DELT|nr:hypothetical protein [Microvenator marinus]QED27157.1 hypothetical protein FRD01_07850 [Microvenator marinus]